MYFLSITGTYITYILDCILSKFNVLHHCSPTWLKFIIVFEKYAQILILYLESMSQEEWSTLGIVLLISFIIIFIFGITNRVVIFYNGMDLFWTASIFLIPVLSLIIGGSLQENNSIAENESTISIYLVGLSLSLFCVLKVIFSSIKYNGLILGLFIGFFKIISAVIIAILSIGLIGKIFNNENATTFQRLFGLVLFGILLFVIGKLINWNEVMERRAIAQSSVS